VLVAMGVHHRTVLFCTDLLEDSLLELLGGIRVVHRDHALGHNGAVVKLFVHKVDGGARHPAVTNRTRTVAQSTVQSSICIR